MAENFDQSSAQVQAAVDSAMKGQKKKKKKKRLIILGVVLAVVIAIAAIASGGDDDGPKPVEGGTTASSQAKDETTQPKTEYKVGEAVQLSDDIKIEFTGCDANCKNGNQYLQPDAGMKYVKATFTFTNTGDSDVSLDGFDCYADDTAYDETYAFDDYRSPVLESISAGKKFNAVVYYQVPKDAKSIILQYETNYFSSDYIDFVIQ